MNSTYARILSSRTDMTEWLVHFTRMQEVDSRIKTGVEILRDILIEGALRPGFSLRSGNRTVYGPTPAVCFSEQPLSAVKTYIEARKDPWAASAFGLLLHKHDAFAAGAMPVIYGLTDAKEIPNPGNYPTGTRLLDPSCLSVNEQYRYLTFFANGSKGDVDWSHEREWRWPANAVKHAAATGLFLLGERETFGRGSYGARVHVFVKTVEQHTWLKDQLNIALSNGQVGKFPELSSASPRFAADYSAVWVKALSEIQVVVLDNIQTSGSRFEYELEVGNTFPLL